MKLIKTQDAVGQILCHDITQIIKGVTKDAVFRKGHVIEEKDIPILLSVGKDHIYVWENNENMLHEDDAAEILRQICHGEGMRATQPKEGKIELIATIDGVLTIDVEKMDAVNALGDMMIATRHSGFPVKAGDKLAGTRVIPLAIEKEKMEQAKRTAGDQPLLNVLPFQRKTYGLITTGNEVFHGRIKDTFSPVIQEKMDEFGAVMKQHVILDDNHEKITAAIQEMVNQGVDMVICTGGMSVDPDDKTPLAIKNSGAKIISYGAPVLPGAMFLIGYMENGCPVMGLPGCVMYAKRTIFDLVLPSVLANIPVTAQKLSKFGEGGLCLNCEECTFPKCSFGK